LIFPFLKKEKKKKRSFGSKGQGTFIGLKCDDYEIIHRKKYLEFNARHPDSSQGTRD